MPGTSINDPADDEYDEEQNEVHIIQPSENTPLVPAPSIESIHNPLQERLLLKRQKKVYSAITLADIFQKVVHTTVITSFLLFAYSYLNLPYENSLCAFYIFSICSGVLAGIINLNIEYFLSRQRAIVVGFIIYIIGLAFLAGLSGYLKEGPQYLQYVCIAPLLLICIGDGICKSCLGDFTHTQFEERSLSEKLSFYLIKLFWIGHLGAFFLVLFLLGIVEYTRFDVGYGLCCVCILAGLIAFCSAWSRYEAHGRNKSSVVKLIWLIIFEARRKKRQHITQRKRASTFHESLGGKDFVQHWLDFAKHSIGGSNPDTVVDQTKSFFRISALFVSFIPYWICNAQGYSTFIYQGFHLKRTFGDAAVPVTWVALFHIAAVLIVVRVLDKLVYPYLRKRGLRFPSSWRIIAGMIFGMLSMIFAGSVEYVAHKRYDANSTTFHMVGHTNVTYVTDIHVLWLTPQFVFLGISEVLVGLTGLGMAYKLCKGLLQKGITSMYYFTVAMGHVISAIIIMCGWFPSGHYLDDSKMVIFFFCMAGMSLLSLILFLIVANRIDFSQPPPLARYQSISRSRDSML